MWSQIVRHGDKVSPTRMKRSWFRRKFHLNKLDRMTVHRAGLAGIKNHAENIIEKSLKEHDAKRTPYSGHPVFTAQHATATCCRKCLLRWHQIPMYRPLFHEEKQFVIRLISRWIQDEMKPKYGYNSSY